MMKASVSKLIVSFLIFFNRFVDHILGQIIITVRIRLQPVSDILLIIGWLPLPRLIAFKGPETGKGQPSYDKQYVRDWLKANPDSNYDLPQDVIDKTVAKYKEAFERLKG